MFSQMNVLGFNIFYRKIHQYKQLQNENCLVLIVLQNKHDANLSLKTQPIKPQSVSLASLHMTDF